jgi:hypothetical protein
MAACGRDASDDLVPVEGRITLDDEPLTLGSISFRPDPSRGNKTKQHPTGTIDFQGNYKLYTVNKRGAPPGWYKVLIFAYQPAEDAKPTKGAMPPVTKALIPEKYSDPRKTDVNVEVVKGDHPGPYDIKLRK